jgi:hypothetical protein
MPLDSKHLTLFRYPATTMPFYVYGNRAKAEWHIEHVLLGSPNIQLNSDNVILSANIVSKLQEYRGPLVLHLHHPEAAMHPFPSNDNIKDAGSRFFFKPHANFVVSLMRTINFDVGGVIAKGTVELSGSVFIDTDMLNMNPVRREGEKSLAGSYEYYSSAAVKEHSRIPLLEEIKQSPGEIYLAELVCRYRTRLSWEAHSLFLQNKAAKVPGDAALVRQCIMRLSLGAYSLHL